MGLSPYPQVFTVFARIGDVVLLNTDVTNALGFTPENAASKGVNSGYASLDSSGKVPTSQLPASVLGAVSYQGTWNANTNSPTLVNGTGTKGNYYKVSVAGSTTIDGNTDWHIGDWIVFDGTVWEKIDNNELVTSVFGRVGAVVMNSSDVNTALGYTPANIARLVSSGTGLSGGGDLSADRTISLALTAGLVNATNHAHANHTGLTSGDDHTQYALLAGRSGGQTLSGDTASSGNLTLQSTAHATKGFIILGSGGLVGVNQATPTAQLHVVQAVNTSGSPSAIIVTGGAHTTLAASTEAIDVNLNLARTVQFATGALTTQRAMVVQAPTYAFVGASTISTGVTLEVTGAPIAGTNATLTKKVAFRALAGVATGVPIVAQAAASQSANIQEWQDSTGTSLVAVTSAGAINFSPGGANAYISWGGSGSQIVFGSTSLVGIEGSANFFGKSDSFQIQFGGSRIGCITYRGTASGGGLLFIAATAAGIPIVVKGAASQTANLQQWQDSTTAVLASVLKTGDIAINALGAGLQVAEGSNAKMGTGTLVGGTATISTTAAKTNSRIFVQDTNTGALTNVGSLVVSAISNGVSFTVTSSNVLDTSPFNWIIFDPA